MNQVNKLLILIVGLTLVLSGCTITDNNEEEQDMSVAESLQELNDNQHLLHANESEEIDQSTLYQGDIKGETSFVGYGINLFYGPTYSDGLGKCVFKESAYGDENHPSKYIYSDPLEEYKATLTVSDELKDAFSQLQVDAAISTGKKLPFFSASVSAQFDKSATVTSSSKFYNSVESYIFKKQFLDVDYATAKSLLASGLLMNGALSLINNSSLSADELFSIIGTHIITSAGTGASINVSSIITSNTAFTNQQIKAAFDFKSAFVEGGVSASFKTDNKEVHESSNFNINGRGGKVSLLSLSQDIEVVGKSIYEWRKTIKDTPTLAYVYNAIPIWEFASSYYRREILEKAFYSIAASTNKKLDKTTYFTTNTDEFVITSGKTYIFKSYYGHKSIHVKYQSEYEARLEADDFNTIGDDRWIAQEVKGKKNVFTFKNADTGLHMCILFDGLYQSEYGGETNFMFTFEDLNDGTYFIIPIDSPSRAVSTSDNYHIPNGIGFTLFGKSDSNKFQHWFIIPVNNAN